MERSKVGIIPYLDKEVLKRRDCLEDSCWDGGFAFGLLPGRSMGSIRSQHQGDCRLCMWDIRTYRGKGELHAMPYNCLRRPPFSLSLPSLYVYSAPVGPSLLQIVANARHTQTAVEYVAGVEALHNLSFY